MLTVMTQREVARALGLSRSYVRPLERRALVKLARHGGEDAKLPAWIQRTRGATPKNGGRRKCGQCGALGHNRQRCTKLMEASCSAG